MGCFPRVKNGILVGLRVILPMIVDDRTLFIWLHEYLHAIFLYKKIGVEYDVDCEDFEEEVLPVCYEKLFVLDNPEYGPYYEKREDYLKNTFVKIYRNALEKRDSLVKKLRK